MASNLENGVDFISNMPDLVLQLILQGLPNTEEVVRTSVLSTRWRYVWTSIPLFPSLDIDRDRLPSPSMTPQQAEKLEDFVSWALANKTLDLDSFRLRCAAYFGMPMVWRWVNAAVTRKVKRLDLMVCTKMRAIVLPHYVVTSESLESLRLYMYGCLFSFPDCKGFSALKVLELNSVSFYRANFVGLENCLKMCLLLEKLTLIDCMMYDTDIILRIPCLKLKTLIIHNCVTVSFDLVSCPELVVFECVGRQVTDSFTFFKMCPLLEELRLINCYERDGILEISCPKLKTLIIHGRDGWTRSAGLVVSCPQLVVFECVGIQIRDPFILKKVESLKTAVILPQCKFDKQFLCKILARISHVESLSLDCSSVRYACDPEGNFPKSLPNLKTLELTTTFECYDLKLLIRILTCSPNLESIHLISHKVCYGSDWNFLSLCLEFLGRGKWKLDIAGARKCIGENCLQLATWRNEVNYHEKSMETLNEVLKFHKASSSVKLVTLLKKMMICVTIGAYTYYVVTPYICSFCGNLYALF